MPNYRGKLLQKASLKPLNTWRAGGNADHLFQPADALDLSHFLQQYHEHSSITWIGLGSNILVRDGGVRGLVILPTRALNQMNMIDTYTARAEAGVISAQFARFCARRGLGQSAFFAGIPGTVGGALAMNAGAFGGETWNQVIAVETIDRYGQIHIRQPREFDIHYRYVGLPAEEWFLAGYFRFPESDPQTQKSAIRELLTKRSQTQPIGKNNCGSVFRNPEGNYAASLIEQAGFKGYSYQGVHVSTKHANFIINDDQATAKAIETVIDHIRQVVFETFGYELTPEVHIIGDPLTEPSLTDI